VGWSSLSAVGGGRGVLGREEEVWSADEGVIIFVQGEGKEYLGGVFRMSQMVARSHTRV
jgi:hypothetical protein